MYHDRPPHDLCFYNVCPCCGRGLPYLPPNFYPWLGQCPKCGHEQMISAYNVKETCEQCGFDGMRDDYINDTHNPN